MPDPISGPGRVRQPRRLDRHPSKGLTAIRNYETVIEMPRKQTPREEQRIKRIGIPVTDAEYGLIDTEAQWADMTIADMCRRIILDKLQGRAITRLRERSRQRRAAEEQARRDELKRQEEARRRAFVPPASIDPALFAAGVPLQSPTFGQELYGSAHFAAAPDPEPPAATTPTEITAEERLAFRQQFPGMVLSDSEVDILIQHRRKGGD
jgi:hypothetical protein